jgi:hypothetical protein
MLLGLLTRHGEKNTVSGLLFCRPLLVLATVLTDDLIGDVVYTRLLSLDNIIINSEQVARDLLDHRSQNYSDRPEIATNEM